MNEPGVSTLRRLSPMPLEELARISALLVASIYGLGMFVVTLHQAQYGLWPVEILKPRAFGAGLLLLATWALGSYIAAKSFGLFGVRPHTIDSGITEDDARVLRLADLCCASGYVAPVLSLLMFDRSGSFPDSRGWSVAVALAASAATVFAAKKPGFALWKRNTIAMLAMCAVTAAFLKFDHEVGALAAWLFACGFITLIVPDWVRELREGAADIVVQKLLILITAVTFFAGAVYGRVVPRLGGGYSPKITILLQQDLPFAKASVPLQMFLLDENERGLHLIRSRSSRQAIWLPRASIAALIHDGANASQNAATK